MLPQWRANQLVRLDEDRITLASVPAVAHQAAQ
jgi:hypothetical protein